MAIFKLIRLEGILSEILVGISSFFQLDLLFHFTAML